MAPKITRRTARIGIASVAVLALGMSGTALAVTLTRPAAAPADVTGFSGKGSVAMKAATSTAGQSFSGTEWIEVTGSALSVGVPSGSQRTVSALFSGESTCSSASATVAGCAVRIVAKKSGSSTVYEFYPKNEGGVPFFDSVGAQPDRWETHTALRIRTLGSGVWRIAAQAKTTQPSGTTLVLTGWAHQVEVYAK